MSTRARLAAILFATVFASACGTGTQAAPSATAAPSVTPAAITVSEPWARAAISSASDGMGGSMMGAAGNSAVYMTIKNSAATADRLVKAESDAAGAAELHTVSMVNGLMQMRPVEAIDVPGGGSVTLAPGGFHLMLIGLKRDLKGGESVKVTLTFEKFGALVITAPVRAG